MRFTIQHGLSAEALLTRIPAPWRWQLPIALREPLYTLIQFRSDVVLSWVVEAALAHATDAAGRVVARGGCFTLESLALFSARDALILSRSDYVWSDASYRAIHRRSR